MRTFIATVAVAALLAACSSSPAPVPFIIVHTDGTCDITGLVHPTEAETATIHGTQCKVAPLGTGLTAFAGECGMITCTQGMCQSSATNNANCNIRDFGPGWTIREE
jgi:hypothetical protein